LPEAFAYLFEPARYKVAYGGRGGGKSWAIADALVIQGAQRQLRILCAREIQRSIEESVHQLLVDRISALGLDAFYSVTKTHITGANGTTFAFAGLRDIGIASLKSYEGIDICWVEEAATVSKRSWATLIPTIRKEGSEIWISFNPQLDSDETYRRFVVTPPSSAVVRKIGWQDNPWYPSTLLAEMQELRDRDPDEYLHVYEGHCRQVLEGAVYAAELRKATEAGKICKVPYDPTKPVHTFWDLGFGDATSIWFAQSYPGEFRVIDYEQDNQKPLPHYLQLLQGKGYIYGTDWLPHDARARNLGTGRSIEELMRAAGRTVRIVPQLSLVDGINAARTTFPLFTFDEDKTADGLQCLRHYRYERDEVLGTWKKTPLHDWASHGADAFRYMAIALKAPEIERKAATDARRPRYAGPGAWMT
jgi:phage terminase large subunit